MVSRTKKVHLYDLRSHNIDRLRYTIANYDWSTIIGCSDIRLKYAMFIDAVKFILHKTVPCKIVKLKPKDPYFVTPLIKSLLVRRCRLRKRGRTE